MAGTEPPKTHKDERRLQIIFGIAIALVLFGVIAFCVLAIKDLQH